MGCKLTFDNGTWANERAALAFAWGGQWVRNACTFLSFNLAKLKRGRIVV